MEDEEEAEDSDFDSDLGTGGRSPAAFRANRTSVSSFLTSAESLLKLLFKTKFRSES